MIQDLLAKALLQSEKCHFLGNLGLIWESDNSRVTSLPYFDVRELLPDLKIMNLACSLVTISGESNEDLHFHTSTVIAIATTGQGTFTHKHMGDDTLQRRVVVRGDVMIIPKSVLHLFHTEKQELLEYISLEVSDQEIDYQKHWTPEDLELFG